jgi:hypothetical protein
MAEKYKRYRKQIRTNSVAILFGDGLMRLRLVIGEISRARIAGAKAVFTDANMASRASELGCHIYSKKN